jgi:hypothetical protein
MVSYYVEDKRFAKDGYGTMWRVKSIYLFGFILLYRNYQQLTRLA